MGQDISSSASLMFLYMMVVALAFGCATGLNAAQPSGLNVGRDAAGRIVCDPDGCVPLDGEVRASGTFFGEDAPHPIIHEGEGMPDRHIAPVEEVEGPWCLEIHVVPCPDNPHKDCCETQGHMTVDPYFFAFHMDVVDNFFITPPYVDVPEHFLIARGQPDIAIFFMPPPSVWGYGIHYGPTPMPGD